MNCHRNTNRLWATFARFHSNWAQVKKHKAEVDLEKSRQRSKLTSALRKAVRAGGSTDPEKNSWLKKCLEDCREAEVPRHVVQAAMEKAASNVKSGQTIVYEGRYKSIFLLVETQTDNRLRTAPQLKKIFKDFNAQMAEKPGECSWVFKKSGFVDFHAPITSEDIDLVNRELENLRSVATEIASAAQAQNLPLNRTTVEALLPSKLQVKQLEEYERPLIRSSSGFMEAVLERSIELEAEDVQIVHDTLPQNVVSSNDCRLAQSTQFMIPSDFNWHDYFPRIETGRVLCPSDRVHVVRLGIEEFNCGGVKPVIMESGHVYRPNTEMYDLETVWQFLPSDSESREEVMGLLEELKAHDDVIDVWHNIADI